MGCCVLTFVSTPCTGAELLHGGWDPAGTVPQFTKPLDECVCQQLKKEKEGTGSFLPCWRTRLRVVIIPAFTAGAAAVACGGAALSPGAMSPIDVGGWSIAVWTQGAQGTMSLFWVPAAAGAGELWRGALWQRWWFCPPWELEIAEDKALDPCTSQCHGDGHRWRPCGRGFSCAGKPSGAVLQGDALL